MVMDCNPYFGRDENFENSARKVADMLWEGSKGNLQAIPSNYVESLGHEYLDGSVSLLNLLNKVSLSGKTYEEFSEVVEHLLYTQASDWPAEGSILEIQSEKLLYEVESEEFDFSEFEFDFAEPRDVSDKVELFLKKVISSVYLDGVSSVTDKEGNPPNISNRYLMAPDYKSFAGTFYDRSDKENVKKFDFEVKEGSNGDWQIKY